MASVGFTVSRSRLKYPTEKDWSPYWMPYIHAFDTLAQRGLFPVIMNFLE